MRSFCLLALSFAILFGGCRPQRENEAEDVEIAVQEQQLASNQEIAIHFTGTVTSIEMLGKRALEIIPVDFDARWALTIHVDSVRQGKVPFEPGNTKVFGIHSPARLLHGSREDAIGKTYDFELSWTISATNESRFHHLRAKPGKRK